MGISKSKEDESPSLAGILELLEQDGIVLTDEQLREVYENLNKAIAKELDLSGCMSFLKDPEQRKGVCFSARHGTGPLYDRIKNRPLISSNKNDIFSICLNRREDILIQDAGAGKIAKVIPEWIHERGEIKSLIIMPASIGKELFAIFVGVKSDGTPVEIEPATHKRLRHFRTRLSIVESNR